MIKKLISSKYLKSIMQLTTGSLIAQLITIIVAPISTRLYSPEQLGIYTLIITILAIFGPVMCGKYDLAIVTAKDEKEVMNLIVGSALFSLISLTIVTICYEFYLLKHPEIIEEVGMFAYLLIVLLVISSITNILISYNNKNKEYKTISSVYVVRTLFQNIGIVTFGILKMGAIGLLFAQILGSLFGLKKQGEHLYKRKFLLKDVKFIDIKSVLFKYKKQPIYSMPAHFINSSSYSILNFFISGLFGLKFFGYYSMSYRILGLPLSLVSMNVSKVFFQRAQEEKENIGSYNKTLINTTILLAMISIPLVIILMTFGPSLFELIFGEGWNISGEFVRILAPMFGIRLIVSALTPALIISNKQNVDLLVQSMFIICSIVCYFTTKFFNLEIYFFLTLITIFYSLIYVILYITIYRLSKIKENI